MTAGRDDESRRLSWFDEGQRALDEGRTEAALHKLGVAASFQPGAATYALLARARARRREWVDAARLAAAAIGMGDATQATRFALAEALDGLAQGAHADRWRAEARRIAWPDGTALPTPAQGEETEGASALQTRLLLAVGAELPPAVPAAEALTAAGRIVASRAETGCALLAETAVLNASLPTRGGLREAVVAETFVSALAVSRKAVRRIRAGLDYRPRRAFDEIVRFGAQAGEPAAPWHPDET